MTLFEGGSRCQIKSFVFVPTVNHSKAQRSQFVWDVGWQLGGLDGTWVVARTRLLTTDYSWLLNTHWRTNLSTDYGLLAVYFLLSTDYRIRTTDYRMNNDEVLKYCPRTTTDYWLLTTDYWLPDEYWRSTEVLTAYYYGLLSTIDWY
jgi:hypothetical protein